MDSNARRAGLHALRVGLLVAAGLALFAVAVLTIGSENRLFVPRAHYNALFDDAAGLRDGSPVTMSGVRIGTVDEIVLPRDPGAKGIEVRLSIDEHYAGRVRGGTLARLAIYQIVANEKVLDLAPGDPARPQLADGARVPTAGASELLARGQNIAETVEAITVDVRELLAAIRQGRGLVGKAIMDPSFGEEGLAGLEGTLASLSRTLEKIERGRGLAGRLLLDQAFADRLTGDLGAATASLAATARRLESGEGLLGAMTRGPEGATVVADLAALSRSLRGLAEAIERGQGLAGFLLSDRARAERIAANIDETTARMASIARKIDQGDGTLGLLVNDRKLHDDAIGLVNGVRESRLAMWLIRRYQGKGRDSAQAGVGADGADATYSAPPAKPADNPGERHGPGGSGR